MPPGQSARGPPRCVGHGGAAAVRGSKQMWVGGVLHGCGVAAVRQECREGAADRCQLQAPGVCSLYFLKRKGDPEVVCQRARFYWGVGVGAAGAGSCPVLYPSDPLIPRPEFPSCCWLSRHD